MKKRFTKNSPGGHSRFSGILLICLGLTFIASCEREKVTIVYGTVTDQNKQPVDSILVMLHGMHFTQSTFVTETYTDGNGNYELVSTSKKFNTINVIIPFYPLKNPKYQINYNGFTVKKNDASTNNCCTATAGEKTKYDFELISR